MGTKTRQRNSFGNKLIGLVLMLGEDIFEKSPFEPSNLSMNIIPIPYYNPSIAQPSRLHPAVRNLRGYDGRTDWQIIQRNQPQIYKKKYHLRI